MTSAPSAPASATPRDRRVPPAQPRELIAAQRVRAERKPRDRPNRVGRHELALAQSEAGPRRLRSSEYRALEPILEDERINERRPQPPVASMILGIIGGAYTNSAN